MSFGVFKNNPDITMDSHHIHDPWGVPGQTPSNGSYRDPELDPRLFAPSNPSPLDMDGTQSSFDFPQHQMEFRYSVGSTDQFITPGAMPFQDRYDGSGYLYNQPHNPFVSGLNGLPSPPSDFSQQGDTSRINDEENVTDSSLDRSSTGQSDYASRPYVAGTAVHRQPMSSGSELNMMGISTGPMSHTEHQHQHHRMDSGTSLEQVMAAGPGERDILAQHFSLPFLSDNGLDPYPGMAQQTSHSPQSHALPFEAPASHHISHVHLHAHHGQEHSNIAHIPAPAPASSVYTLSPSPSGVDDWGSPTEADAESDSDFDPRAPSRGKAGKQSRRPKAQRAGKQAGHSRQPSGDSTRGSRDRPNTGAGVARRPRGRGVGTSLAAQNAAARTGIDSLENGNSGIAKNAPKRDYICLFAPYGCKTSFTAKNEWSRHMRTQHLKSDIYRCSLCIENGGAMALEVPGSNSSRPSTSSSSSASPASSSDTITNNASQSSKKEPGEFKRKDLFTPHLRRMHLGRLWPELYNNSITDDPLINAAREEIKIKEAQNAAKGANVTIKLSPEAEVEIERLVKKALVAVRQPPEHCICPICPIVGTSSSSGSQSGVEGTDQPKMTVFEGSDAWEKRMDHIATQHFSRIRRTSASGTAEVPASDTWVRDEALESWLLAEGVADRDGVTGAWKCNGVRTNGREGYGG
jgi:hypothetical protein